MPVLLVVLGLALSPVSRAQFSSGGTGALGQFANTATVKDVTSPTPKDCDYDTLILDLTNGKVYADVAVDSAGASCIGNLSPNIYTGVVATITPTASGGYVEVTPSPFGVAPPLTGFPDGLLDVTNFLLFPSKVGTRCPRDVNLFFLRNANNTPVMIRATGNVTVGTTPQTSCTTAITNIILDGAGGGNNNGQFGGFGGLGSHGGYRGGDGGLGGGAASGGAPGLGPGGGPGGPVGFVPNAGPVFLTTGTTVAGSLIPPGNDLMTMERGGSGGGGSGGVVDGNGGGGGAGGGGAITIAASGTITVDGGRCCFEGGIWARGAIGGSGGPGRGANGTGGFIRLVASTITGPGDLHVGFNFCCPSQSGPGVGNLRLEAFTISHTGNRTGNQSGSSSPGSVIPPGSPTAFLRFAKVNDGTTDVLVPAATQASSGRTGDPSSVDITMPSLVNTVTVTVEAGPNTGSNVLGGKIVTLVVAPKDPGQPAAFRTYTQALSCPSPGAGNCTANFSSVTLPTGISSFSAFFVVNLSSTNTLSRMFPSMFEGEEIEAVRMETGGSDTQYVLVAKSGKEFPYQPGR